MAMSAYEKAKKALFHSDRNLFITGPGGTGKTTLLREYINATDQKLILCAATGTAAVNIGGETIHRIFGVPVPAYGAKVTEKQKKNIRMLATADAVIIDEISMCRNDVFAFLYKVLKKAEKEKGSPIRLIVSGDFLQLPPVVKKDEQKLAKKAGLDPSGWAFACKEWHACHFKTVELTEVKRQENTEYIEALNRLRIGDTKDLDWFNEHVKNEDDCPEDAVYICGTNAEADRVNASRIDKLETQPVYYECKKTGRVINPPADNVVGFRPEERVMFTVNSEIPGRYQNGLMGTVKACYPDHVIVTDDSGRDVQAYPHVWHLYTYGSSGGNLKRTETGTFTQIPLKPAYAITIHKSQGKTFDEAVISPQAFAPGQLYVALSRVRKESGLYLTSPVTADAVMADPVAEKFIQNGYDYPVSELPKPRKKPAKKVSTVKKKAGRKTSSGAAVKKRKSSAGTVKRKPAVKKSVRKTSSKPVRKPVARKKSVRKPVKRSSKKTSVRRK